jgi:transcriptional regulator with XRE-family HTH domain
MSRLSADPLLAARAEAAKRQISLLDDLVGARIRERRTDLGLTQRQLADRINLAPPQVLRYERGSLRLSAGRFYEIARALNMPIDYYFTKDWTARSPAGYPSISAGNSI